MREKKKNIHVSDPIQTSIFCGTSWDPLHRLKFAAVRSCGSNGQQPASGRGKLLLLWNCVTCGYKSMDHLSHQHKCTADWTRRSCVTPKEEHVWKGLAWPYLVKYVKKVAPHSYVIWKSTKRPPAQPELKVQTTCSVFMHVKVFRLALYMHVDPIICQHSPIKLRYTIFSNIDSLHKMNWRTFSTWKNRTKTLLMTARKWRHVRVQVYNHVTPLAPISTAIQAFHKYNSVHCR